MTSGKQNIILQTEGLSKEFAILSPKLFGSKQTLYALNDVSLRVEQGKTLGVIGESGCGKSTFGKCVVGLQTPSKGKIRYMEEELKTSSSSAYRQVRKDIQMIFQDPYSSLNPKKTCGTIIEEPLIIHGLVKGKKEREQRVIELMEEVGLNRHLLHRYPHEFSGGQRQRINIARALALDPRLIVCDEPVSALDVSIQAQVINLFMRLQKERGLTYVFISHDLSVIRHISDEIVIMYLGSVVEQCKAEEIYTSPLHPYTQALLSAVPPNRPGEKREQIELSGEIPSPIGKTEGCALKLRCPKCMDVCKHKTPQLVERDGGHKIACFLYQ